MSKSEVDLAPPPARPSMLSTGIYKRSQGRIVRQATFGAVALIVALGCWAAYFQLDFLEPLWRYVVVSVVLVAGVWGAFRVVNVPKFADFLIAVEIEMTKVSWPSKTDLVRTSAVVMFTIFGLAGILFLYDFIWQRILKFIGVLGV